MKCLAAVLICLVTATAGAAEDDQAIMQRAALAFDRGDVMDAMALYRGVAERGDAIAQYKLASLLDYAEENEQAAQWYQRAAEGGNADAAYGLGRMHASGDGVERDMGVALKWYDTAAGAGQTAAIRSLVEFFESGSKEHAADPARAVSWLERGVTAGDAWCRGRLARALRNGELGLAKDAVRAASLEADPDQATP